MEKITSLNKKLTGKTIGIIGFGHLGASLALPLAKNFAEGSLLISCRGSESTITRAKTLGLGQCLTDTESLLSASDIIFVACRPQDLLSLPASAVKDGALVVSCMAGLPLSLLSRFFSGKVVRMMCSGPDTIENGLGIAVTWPQNDLAEDVIRLMEIELYSVSFEEELDSFTVGICIPPILFNVSRSEEEITDALGKMRSLFPVYGALDGWIKKVAMAQGAAAQSSSLENVKTKGGISEAMMLSLKSGGTFHEALTRGLERGREITADIRRNIAQSSEAGRKAAATGKILEPTVLSAR